MRSVTWFRAIAGGYASWRCAPATSRSSSAAIHCPRGNAERHTLILGYAKEPNLIGRAERTKKLFGRLADVHRRQRDEAPERTDTLSD